MRKINIGMISLILVSSVVSNLASAAGSVLSLDEYLQQVRTGHQGVRGSLESSTAAFDRSREGSLLLAPTAFANAALSSDEKVQPNPPAQGTRTVGNAYSLGVSQLTTFGLSAKLAYNVTYAHVYGVNPAYVPQSSFHDSKPSLEVRQSLWRNGFGREVRATQDLLEAQALAQSYAESYRVRLLMADAEVTYWRLALARETVTVQKETLARAEKMRDWNSRRVQLQLADRSDLLQADAMVAGRRLELQAALDEEVAASRAFNTARGLGKDEVSERLSRFERKSVDGMPVPQRAAMRDDVKAAQQQERVAIANGLISREKNSPTFDVFGSIGLNGHDPAFGTSVGNSFQTGHPAVSGGLQFSVPLAFGTLSDVRAAYARDIDAAGLQYQRKVFEQDRDWNDLVNKFNEAKHRLTLAAAIEASQKEKLMHERDRLNRGRTVTFQVLTFEQDYLNAQLAHIRAQADVLRLYAQLKTFGGAS